MPGGCVHCRDEQQANARVNFRERRRLNDATRREFGLIAGRLFSPVGDCVTATNRPFGTSVLPAGFQLA